MMKYSPWIIAFFLLIGGILLGMVSEPKSQAYAPPANNHSTVIEVTIDGAVVFPGTYELDGRLTVTDAIKRAGGSLTKANLTGVNMQASLFSTRQIFIPYQQEEAKENDTSGKLNINTASAEELASLPGIGPSLANAIVSYRTKQGFFISIEDLKKVTGIGVAKYEGIQDLISIG